MSTTRHSTKTTTKNAKQSNANAPSDTSSSTPKLAPGAMSGPRKLSARRQTKGLLSRRLSKPTEQSAKAPSAGDGQSTVAEQDDGKWRQRESQISQDVQEQQPKPIFPVKSIIPDPLAELPSWYSTDAQGAIASSVQFRKKYPMHNPVGPRYYKNHHLSPSLDKRPPSVFSPSFPPMAASTDRLPETAQLPDSSRSSTGSPLPTPSSSQVRIHDVRVRTRKVSQTAHDTVDMLDHTDPWGTNWHHQSPYDVGKNKDRASPDSPESPTAPTRPRRASMTNGPRHRATVPSPLSQSTSAVHLASEPLSSHGPRRLSKRRKTFRGLFGGSDHENRPFMSRGGSSATGHADGRALDRKLSHTGSIVQPSIASSGNSIALADRSSKRQSVLGRLVKRFSVLRRSDGARSMQSSFHSVGQSSEHDYGQPGSDSPGAHRSESPEKVSLKPAKPKDVNRRVPAPTEDVELRSRHLDDSQPKDHDTQSVTSVDQRYSMGRLTVANPDDPNSSTEGPERGDPSPVQPYSNCDMPFRSSPEPMEYPPPHPPFHGIPVRAPLSVISEGETYMSSPRMQPASPKGSPATPPTIPSLLSLPARSAAIPADHPISPPLPSFPYSPSLPEIPTVTSIVSSSAVPKQEPSLPPTPVASRPPTPPTPPVSSKPEHQLEPVSKPRPEPPTHSDRPKTHSFIIPNAPYIYQPIDSYVDNSSLARASMIVNPPTPYTSTITIPVPTPPAVAPTPLPKNEPKSPAMGEPPSSPTKDGSRKMRSKRTETFKLVRTASGHVQTVDDTFVADGEHWRVVESPKEERSSLRKSRRERDHSDEQEKPERRRSKRAEKESASEESDHQRGHSRTRRASDSQRHREAESSPSQVRTSRDSYKQRSSAHERRRSSREGQADAMRSTQTPVIYSSRPHASSTAMSTVSGARLEPRTSVSASTRPSSEFQSVADINALKAKDAWEIERLWKGRSMIHVPDGLTANANRHHISSDSRPSTIMSHDLHRASTIPSIGGDTTVLSAYGSSHTVYTMHSPYQGPPHAATYPHFPASSHSERPTNGVTQYTGTTARYVSTVEVPPLPPLGSSPPRPNPLPEPPRLSSYKPSPLPLSLASSGDGPSSPEYWNRYAGVTVTH